MNNTLSFSKIEFLLILVSIVYGFCIVDLFDNWARMLRRSVYYWETTTWSIILFLCIAFLWYNAWDNVGRIAETSVNYVLALLPPICFFVLTSLLFPDKTSQETLKAAFHRNRKKFFLTLAGILFMIIVSSNMTGDPKYHINMGRGFFFAASLLLAFIDRESLRALVAALAFCWFGYLLTDPYSQVSP